MRDYAASLDVPAEGNERRLRLDQAAAAAAVTPLPAGKHGHACVAEIDLARLQETLGTRYDLSP